MAELSRSAKDPKSELVLDCATPRATRRHTFLAWRGRPSVAAAHAAHAAPALIAPEQLAVGSGTSNSVRYLPLGIFLFIWSFSQEAKEAFRASVIFLFVPGVSGGTCAGLSATEKKERGRQALAGKQGEGRSEGFTFSPF